jgi:RimJ/RimL family protein N-acetyltransferase
LDRPVVENRLAEPRVRPAPVALDTLARLQRSRLAMTMLTTSRLRLEPFQDAHFDGLFAVNSDPVVMRYITGRPDTAEDTRAGIERVKARWVEWGFSWWSFFESETGQIIGSGCIQYLGHDSAHPLEIGWRLRQDKWHHGFASEAARAMAAFAFDTVATPLLCAVCHVDNQASAQVMKRLGMRYRGVEHWYEMNTAVYEMTRVEWQAQAGSPTAGA